MSGGMGGGEAGVDPPTTTKGDLSGFDTTFDRVPIGSNTQVLTADSTEALGLKWATPTGVSLSEANTWTSLQTFQSAQTNLLTQLSTGKIDISSGSISPATNFFLVETESAAATDDLTTVVNTGNQTIIFRAYHGGHTVVCIDGGVTGNTLNGAGDFSLDSGSDMIMYACPSTTAWFEVSRSNNA